MSDRSQQQSNGTTWKSIEQLAGTATGMEQGEFSGDVTSAPVFDSTVSRRGFMALVSASMALTATACRRPLQKLVPAVKSAQTVTPGLPLDYATVYAQRNVAYGALVKSREGRPIKVKGNALHGSNCGTTSSEMQASLLSLYDPDRIRRPRVNKGASSYDVAVTAIANAVNEAQAAGKKAVVLVDEHCSPSFAALMTDVTAAAPAVSFVTMPPIIADGAALANKALLGINGELVPDLGKATVIVSVDNDFLGTDKLAVHHTGRYAARRTPSIANAVMSNVIVAEAGYSLTGSNADTRVKLHPSQFEAFLAVLEHAVGVASPVGAALVGSADAATAAAAKNAASSLKAAGSQGVVLAGRHLSAKANAMALNISNALGSVGAGKVIDPAHVLPYSEAKGDAVRALLADMQSGAVHALIFGDVNPEYSADRAFRTAMAKVPFRAAINMYEDETAGARISAVSIPAAHWLESWGDAVAYDGTRTIQQPLIAPLNEGIPSLQDTIMAVAKKVNGAAFGEMTTYYDYVRSRWNAAADEAAWTKALQDGVVASATPLVSGAVVNAAAGASLASAAAPAGRVLVAMPSLALYDGRYANNGWLLELPDPVTKITWDNVALMSPGTAVGLGLAASTEPKDVIKANEHVIVVSTADGSIELPVWVQVGMADNVIATQLGYGHTFTAAQSAVGSNAYSVAGSGNTCAYTAIKNIEVVEGKRHRIATTQNHHTLDDGNGQRPVAKWVTLGDIKAKNLHSLDTHYVEAEDGKKAGRFGVPLSITSDYEYKGHRWGMVIDMSSCTGCSSCVVACQSENNIPVVGKEQVLRGREMQWIRLDRYYVGDMDNPHSVVEPMLCQHCENAPCENVCPVAATTHSPEGLNEMTYNRCVGTRYCLNNCPYKVRRFNFLNYHTDQRSPLDLVFNPDVTNRMRGVMEKCTFCVQRLHEAKYHAKDQGRSRVNDGEAITACQEACPASAIIFGDMNDPNSRVSKMRSNERSFVVLPELNVRPSVTYLAKVQNAAATPATNGHHS
ncbi:MAG: 4Fe-4S dicluster domain-containing protein [Candidatus Kapabacteria bacterium]|nr:4Fe-4S dicluster domain-containing protein [Candidatus Kapabacteria bacterium]